ncbi:hypothetical protein CHS0354_007217 [Potamilus streckersoni]|uniref:Peptidase M12B domain-containing protein n=1 Tax=Potamilus streckersoni TaxID=2493646 RepID=A0AAE0SM54_9BIVA|nr:hypothetical protein CHS0354_007217 [Potamilus streckersoni]
MAKHCSSIAGDKTSCFYLMSVSLDDMFHWFRRFSIHGKICEVGSRIQIVSSEDYVVTVSTTAHELGHSLGAEHDGEGEAAACKAEDKFIMSPSTSHFQLNKNYSRNPWLFSNCSGESFIKTLANKTCLFTKSVYSEEKINEWKQFMQKLPGELYSPNEQCQIIIGPGSFYCGFYRELCAQKVRHDVYSHQKKIPSMMCRFMYCTDPTTRKCMNKYWTAATGTYCGTASWCKEGLCVRKSAK